MARLNQSQPKIAEKLSILNDRLNGTMARLHFSRDLVKRFRTDVLSEKPLDKCAKELIRKFPAVDTRSNNASTLVNRCTEYIPKLGNCYYTFIEIMELKDHISELLSRINACGVQLNAELNTGLTILYLDLVTNYVALLIMFSQFDDKKIIAALFTACMELKQSSSDKQFPRLAQMMVDYDQANQTMRKLQDEFVSHSRILSPALLSLERVASRRFLRAENWRQAQFLSLLSQSESLVNAQYSELWSLEVLSQERLERWIILGFVVIHPQLNEEGPFNLWKLALTANWVLPLFRDQVIYTHSFIISFFETIRNYSRRVSEVKEWYNYVCNHTPEVHRDRRKYLRNILKELCLLFSDQPGLLGPKVLNLLMTLAYSRDEVLWFARHVINQPQGKERKRTAADGMQDRFLPEFLHHMEQLRQLMRKYHTVVQRYLVQTLVNWDAAALEKELKGQLGNTLMEEEASILSDMLQKISSLTIEQVAAQELPTLEDVRLDWLRIQAKLSSANGVPAMRECELFAKRMNAAAFHTRLVDDIEGLLIETSSLSLLYFHPDFMKHLFSLNIEFPAQHRYIAVFAQLCTHFPNLTHQLCPEECAIVQDHAFQLAYDFISSVCREIIHLVICICEEQTQLSYRLLPKNAAIRMLPAAAAAGKKDKGGNNTMGMVDSDAPGSESMRQYREEMTGIDKYRMALSELCCALQNCHSVQFQSRSLLPREQLTSELEQKFCETLVASQMYAKDAQQIAKPTELLSCLKASLGVLQDLDCFMTIDLPRVFNMVLLQQTQKQDSWHGADTITSQYIEWYCNALLPKVLADAPRVVYSPRFKSFLMIDANQPFPIEEYSDYSEICALAEIIGPYGMKYFDEELCQLVVKQLEDAMKLVLLNSELLQTLRVSFDDPAKMNDYAARLQQAEEFLRKFKFAGIILSFRQLCKQGINSVMQQRSPFLLKTANSLLGDRGDITSLFRNAMGLTSSTDVELMQALTKLQSKPEKDYMLACHTLVFLSVALPRLANNENSLYAHNIEAHYNNAHTIATAINALLPAMLALCTAPNNLNNELSDRWKEFLALCSSSLLRASQDESVGRNLPSVFIILDLIVKQCPYLTASLLEMCFPYALIRQAYNSVGSCPKPQAPHVTHQHHN